MPQSSSPSCFDQPRPGEEQAVGRYGLAQNGSVRTDDQDMHIRGARIDGQDVLSQGEEHPGFMMR